MYTLSLPVVQKLGHLNGATLPGATKAEPRRRGRAGRTLEAT